MSEHLMGRGNTPRQTPLRGPEAGGGEGGGGNKTRWEGVARTYTQPHTLKRLGSSEKGAQGTLGTQWGAEACATQPDAHRH